MALTKKNTVTQEDLEEVVSERGVTLAQIAREADIDRIALSKFRNHGQPLKLADARALVEWMRENDLLDEGNGAATGAEKPAGKGVTPHPRLVAVQSVRFCFPLAESIPDDVVAKVMDQIEDGDARLLALFKEQIEREDGFFSDGEFTEDFTALLQEAFSILASNYVLSRMLRGWTAFGVKPVTDDPKTLRDVLAETTPRAAHRYLCRLWNSVLRKFEHDGIECFGIRVVEPHHDGTPHWHLLMFVHPDHAPDLLRTMKEYALLDSPDEHGAQEHRFKHERIDPAKGSAAQYVANYISKNVDGYGVGTDHEADQPAEVAAPRAVVWARVAELMDCRP